MSGDVVVPPCGVDVSKRPYWMSPDQYDPCPCVLDQGHEGKHDCGDPAHDQDAHQ